MKIIEVTNEIVVNIDLANAIDCRSKKQEKINERLKFQNLALVKTIELESLMEIAYRDNNQESRHIDDDKMNYWVGLLLELRGLIRKWRESTLKGDYWKERSSPNTGNSNNARNVNTSGNVNNNNANNGNQAVVGFVKYQ